MKVRRLWWFQLMYTNYLIFLPLLGPNSLSLEYELTFNRFWQKRGSMAPSIDQRGFRTYILLSFGLSFRESNLPWRDITLSVEWRCPCIRNWSLWPTTRKKLKAPANGHLNEFGSWFHGPSQNFSLSPPWIKNLITHWALVKYSDDLCLNRIKN